MKKIKRVGFLLCLVATMFLLLPVIGCQHSSGGGDWSDDPPEEEEPEKNILNENPSVVSRWVNSSGNYEEILTFYYDGTYTYEKYENDTLVDGQKGTYSSKNDETKLTVTQEWLEGNWSNASGFGFYIKISGNTIEVVIWQIQDGTEKRSEKSSSFTLDTESENTGSGGSGSSSSETPIVADIPTIVAYIEALT